MNKKHTSFLYSALLIWHITSYAESRSVLIGNDYQTYVSQEIEVLTPAAEIMLDQYVFTLDSVRETVAHEAQEGALVSVNMHRAHRSNPSTYYFFEDIHKGMNEEQKQQLLINKYPGKYTLHAKHVSWKENEHCASHIGSHNLTNLGSEANKELMVATYDDEHYFHECKEFHETVRTMCGQIYDDNKAYLSSLDHTILSEVPQERTVLSSLKHDINASLINFINNLPSGSILTLGAFSINDKNICNALCDAADKGVVVSFFLDGQTVDTKTERDILEQMNNHNIYIYLYNNDGSLTYGSYKKKMHAKFFAYQTPQLETCTIISTRNFTTLFGLNLASVHPNDAMLYANLMIWCKKLSDECDRYASPQ